MTDSDRSERGLSILVVEDDGDAASSYAVLLGMFGHRVRTAPDGPTAIRLAAESVPDVALIDIGLPGMDGCAVARAIAPRNAPPPLLVAISGYGQEEDVRCSLRSGFHVHITKPADQDQLVRLLDRFRQVVAMDGEPVLATLSAV
jgi:CheY-like chemotaxis protein